MRNFFKKLRENEAGATAIEYGLIAALVAVAAITGMSAIGKGLQSNFQTVASKLKVPAAP
jgi:pilus assembly protein Flp/PilA